MNVFATGRSAVPADPHRDAAHGVENSWLVLLATEAVGYFRWGAGVLDLTGEFFGSQDMLDPGRFVVVFLGCVVSHVT